MSEKNMQPVFKVTVSMSMQEIIDGVNETAGDEGAAYIPDDVFQKALLDRATYKVMGLFDRNVLSSIQKLTQAEIKDQLVKRVDSLISDALAGPAQTYPEMSLAELLTETIEKEFDFKTDAPRPPGLPTKGSDTPKNRIDRAIKDGIARKMKHFEGTITGIITETVRGQAKKYATAMLNAGEDKPES